MFATRSIRLLALVLSILVVPGLFCGVSMAQTVNAGAISGVVTDPAGALVPGAAVTATNEGTHVTTSAKTGSDGYYSIESLPAGTYTLTVAAEGFARSVTVGVVLDIGVRRADNVTLKVGSAATEVTVTANALQVNTETSESGGTITAGQIDNLLLNGRNFLSLASTVPGVINLNGGDAIGTGGVQGGTTLIINGGSQEYQAYTVDGIGLNMGSLGALDIQPTVDGIEEMRVLKDNYSAKYGLTGSGQILTETKSGADTFHGTGWEYLRNNAFDANNYFSTSSQALHQNIFGYTLGGPVIIPGVYNRDRNRKTFFFASNQWQVIHESQVTLGSVFPEAMRNGDFSASPTLNGNLMIAPHSQALLASEGKTNCLLGSTTLNTACFDPVAVALMNAYWPQPNNPNGGFLNYINQAPLTTTQANFQYRVDHAITPRNQIMARMLYQQVSNDYPYAGGNPAPTQSQQNYTTGLNALIKYTTTFTPNLLNTFGVAESYDKPRINSPAPMPTGVSIIQALPPDPLNRIPNISVSNGWASMGVSQSPVTASDGEGLLDDDASWVKGHHVLQTGALYFAGIKRQTGNGIPQGTFTFTGNHTNDSAADYLLGLDTNYSDGSVQNLGFVHFRQGEAYLQDDWKTLPRLTLNLGVRYVYFSSDSMSGDQVTAFRPNLYEASQAPVVNVDGSFNVNGQNQPLTAGNVPANLLNGLVFAGQNGTPSGFFIPQKDLFAPRFGFAWDLSGRGVTSLRGGYGIGFSRRPVQEIFNAWGDNPPYNPSANITNSLLSNGTAGGTAVAPTPQGLWTQDATHKAAAVQTFSLTFEHQFAANTVFHLAYVGSLGRDMGSGLDENQPIPVTAASVAGCLSPGQNATNYYQYDPCINTSAASTDYTRPYKGYDSINNHNAYQGTSSYNAMQTGLRYKGHSSEVTIAYTWSHLLATCGSYDEDDPSSFGCGAQNPANFRAEYGPPNYDFTHDFNTTWVYHLPFFMHDANTAARSALGGWSFAGIVLFQSGFAVSPWDDEGNSGLDYRTNQVHTPTKIGQVGEWFDTTAFSNPNNGFYGDASNGSIRGPGQASVNTSLYKTFPIGERFKMEFRAEAFNVLNRPNFSQVDAGIGDGSFGQVTTAHDPRQLEFALKLSY